MPLRPLKIQPTSPWPIRIARTASGKNQAKKWGARAVVKEEEKKPDDTKEADQRAREIQEPMPPEPAAPANQGLWNYRMQGEHVRRVEKGAARLAREEVEDEFNAACRECGIAFDERKL